VTWHVSSLALFIVALSTARLLEIFVND
jgi:hypothetical protein